MFNWSELHLSEVNSYKIHILGNELCIFSESQQIESITFWGKGWPMSYISNQPETLKRPLNQALYVYITDLFQNKSVAYFYFVFFFPRIKEKKCFTLFYATF